MSGDERWPTRRDEPSVTPVRIVLTEEQRIADGERRAAVNAEDDWRGRPKRRKGGMG